MPESLQIGFSIHSKFPRGATSSRPVTRSKGQPSKSGSQGPVGLVWGPPQLAEMEGGRAVLSLPWGSENQKQAVSLAPDKIPGSEMKEAFGGH